MKLPIITLLLFLAPFTALAHGGGLDSNDCHTCRTNCADHGLNTNEYHCHPGGDRSVTTRPSVNTEPTPAAPEPAPEPAAEPEPTPEPSPEPEEASVPVSTTAEQEYVTPERTIPEDPDTPSEVQSDMQTEQTDDNETDAVAEEDAEVPADQIGTEEQDLSDEDPEPLSPKAAATTLAVLGGLGFVTYKGLNSK